jgi:group II intron reverse transcriptase/maturase
MINKSYSELWKTTPWRKLRKVLFRLQRRIFKAIREGNKAKARNLQKLVLKSYAARMLASRQVTQLNQGKKTAGVDGKKLLTFAERFELERELKSKASNWKHQGLREIPIPKKDGTTRTLKVPTIADRAWQCMVKYALEPAHEATFHEHSYGFRPGRSAHDAQKLLFQNLNSYVKGKDKRVLELDIEKCFDRIEHKAIMNNLIAPQAIKIGIYRCLKAGINPEFPEQGTPQGGVVSPLLANIALNGLEKLGKGIRYADDCVFILKPGENENKLLNEIAEFLAQRGMNVSQKKTKVTAATDGFDFLGWHFKVQNNGKFRSYPAEDNYQKFRQKVKEIVNSSNSGANEKAKRLAPIIRGWRNYHRYCKMEGSRFSLWYLNYDAFKRFREEKTMTYDKAEKLVNIAFPTVGYAENRHIMVKGNKSPYDGDLVYWSKRNSDLYDGHTSKALKRQNYTCGYCGLRLLSDERVHLHHVDGNHNNWNDKNLVAIHESCHDYVHMSKQRVSGAVCGESRTHGSN